MLVTVTFHEFPDGSGLKETRSISNPTTKKLQEIQTELNLKWKRLSKTMVRQQ